MDDYYLQLRYLTVFFVLICMFVVFISWKRRSVSSGLLIAYLTGYAIIYLPGALLYCSSSYAPESSYVLGLRFDPYHIYEGFKLTCLGIFCFACGMLTLTIFKSTSTTTLGPRSVSSKEYVKKIAKYYLFWGLLLNIVLEIVIQKAPSLSMINSVSFNFFVMGAILFIWSVIKEKKKFFLCLGFLLIYFPAYTMISDGFLGFAIRALVPIFTFSLVFYRPKRHLILISLLLGWIGVSFFVNYMSVRSELREVLWEDSSRSGALDVLKDMVSNFRMFNPENQEDLESIDARLNQNIFVGRSIEYISEGGIDFAKGKTLYYAVISFIPRIIWPGKPAYGGSMDIVSEYTGMKVAHGTSMGVGQVMEFYINFGVYGVCVGFFVLGLLVTLFDYGAAVALKNEDYKGFVYWFMPGLGFLCSAGLLAESIGTVWISFLVCFVVNRFMNIDVQKK